MKPLHIAMVMRLFSSQGGLELYALKLIEGLLARGHKVTAIVEVDESGMAHENLTVQKFAAPKKGASKAQKIEHYLQVASTAVENLGPFDIVHSQHFPLKKLDVVTFHNHTASRLSLVGYPLERLLNNYKLRAAAAYKLRFKYDRELCEQAAMRIFVARVMQEDFYNTYHLPDVAPYALAAPGASMANEPLSENGESAEQSDKFTFLFVGKGMRKKGLDTLFKACSRLKRKRIDFELIIAGLREKKLQRLNLKMMGISNHVRFLGYQKDMGAVYRSARAIILPSKLEPFGMAPIQAMQWGLVPIVSQVCGVAEVLSDGEDALILQDHLNADELSSLMEKLMVNQELYKKLAANSRATAAKVSWAVTVSATEEAYGRIKKEKHS